MAAAETQAATFTQLPRLSLPSRSMQERVLGDQSDGIQEDYAKHLWCTMRFRLFCTGAAPIERLNSEIVDNSWVAAAAGFGHGKPIALDA